MAKIIVLTNAQKNDLTQNFNVPKNKIEIINNWVSPIYLKIKPFKKPRIPKRFDVIFVGRLEKQKNLFQFIEIVARLKNTFPGLKSKIVGTGSQSRLLKQQVKKLKLSTSIYFTGYSTNPAKHYLSSKVFLLTSFFEGQPHSIMESMRFGLPVVAIKSPGIDEIVSDNQTGFAVMNSDEAVNKLELLLKNAFLREKIGRQAMLISYKKYGIKNLYKILKLVN